MSTYSGTAPFTFGSERYHTWYTVFGDLKHSRHRSLVALHGGPGMSHHYMRSTKVIHERAGRPVVLYDQIGSGESSHCTHAPPDFWTIELFIAQLESLLQWLEIVDDFDLLGHSWGGMLAVEYAAKHRPPGLKHLILSNTMASVPLLISGLEKLRDQFPNGYADMMRKQEEEGAFESSEYKLAIAQFCKKHLCTIKPPQDFLLSMADAQENRHIYRIMWGASEFRPTGILKDWTVVDFLHRIQCPSLLLSGRMDQAQEIAYSPFLTNLPNIKWINFENSSHLPQYEEPEK
ncbi:proline-specific peptidase [Pholiota conissans]|uniref:Proline-specific peptidase n=1 Tax=Pholiota conissans TaxID=109636 RepID=A0A9P6D3A8_9AGAR|nr:proline-specific peptidase [Pholiota conissans]